MLLEILKFFVNPNLNKECREMKNFLLDNRLLCRRCKGFAYPTLESKNTFSCKCGHAFSGSYHKMCHEFHWVVDRRGTYRSIIRQLNEE